MRTARPSAHLALVALLAPLGLDGCARNSSRDVAGAPAAAAEPPAGGARVRTSSSSAAPVDVFDVEITPGADAQLIVGFGDRVPDLDVTPTAENPKLAEALVAFAPLKKGARANIRVRARPWSGDDVMRSLVGPLGGDAAVHGLLAGAPEFAKKKLIDVEIAVTSGATTQRVNRQIVMAPGEAFGQLLRGDVGDGVVARGAPVVVEQWVLAAAGDGFTPSVQQRGSALVASTRDGKEVSVAELPAPVWTLWMQLE